MSTVQEKVMINPKDVTMLLIDHQSGLFNLVKDIPVPDLRRNAIALAKVATLLKIPVITTASGRSERPADSRNPPVRSARQIRCASGADQRLGHAQLRQGHRGGD